MSYRKSLVFFACFAVSALPLLVGIEVDTANAAGPFDSLTQNWDKNLPSSSRFTVLADFGGAAVRDKQHRTGVGEIAIDDDCVVA